jgi:hypothetical protein
MDSEINTDSTKGRMLSRIIFSALAVFILYYAIMAMISPARWISEINAQYAPDSSMTGDKDRSLYSDSEYVKLTRGKAYLSARIAMSASDSICLALNLGDSSAILELNGVELYRAGIQKFRADRILNSIDEYTSNQLFAEPFAVNKNYSTIKKEPVMLKIAPRDTSEYKPDIVPDTTHSETVCFVLEMTDGFRLYVYQDNGKGGGGVIHSLVFDLADRVRNCLQIIKSILRFRVPEYHPAIRIRLPGDDARIIYRALPVNGQVAICR